MEPGQVPRKHQITNPSLQNPSSASCLFSILNPRHPEYPNNCDTCITHHRPLQTKLRPSEQTLSKPETRNAHQASINPNANAKVYTQSTNKQGRPELQTPADPKFQSIPTSRADATKHIECHNSTNPSRGTQEQSHHQHTTPPRISERESHHKSIRDDATNANQQQRPPTEHANIIKPTRQPQVGFPQGPRTTQVQHAPPLTSPAQAPPTTTTTVNLDALDLSMVQHAPSDEDQASMSDNSESESSYESEEPPAQSKFAWGPPPNFQNMFRHEAHCT